jgi:hypothetical protein
MSYSAFCVCSALEIAGGLILWTLLRCREVLYIKGLLNSTIYLLWEYDQWSPRVAHSSGCRPLRNIEQKAVEQELELKRT